MGLLDDAIREHLDLKRRRGADTSEVERQEQEALGPPAHGEFAAPAQPPEPVEAPPEPAPEPEPEPDLPPEPPAAVAAGPAPVVVPDPEPDPVAPVPAAEIEPRGDVEDDWLENSESSSPGAATREFTPVEDPAEQTPAEPAGEDVLEETPDFLQETPEHERLWFEQKPPRDFDLDP